jgi:hypothetical protein
VYYRTEGVNDPLVIDFPKGHFQLAFRERREAEFRPPGLVPESRLRIWKLAAAALAVTAAALAWLALDRRSVLAREDSPDPLPPALAAIWDPYFADGRPAIISLGTPMFTKLDGDFFRSPKINEWEDWNTPRYRERLRQLGLLLGETRPAPAYVYTGVGEAAGAFQLCKFFAAQGRELSLQRNSLLSWEQMKGSNVIFLGAPKFNTHLQELPLEEKFVLGRGGIRNLHPRPGEAEIYGEIWNEDRSARVEDHALITRLPGIHSQGTVLVLAGRSTEATLAAVEYVTQPHYAAELVERVRPNAGEFPRYYQVLIRARFDGQVPLHLSYVTHRVFEAVEGSQTAHIDR